MLETIANAVLAVVMIGCVILWIDGITHSDGKCHYDDCEGCMFYGSCPQQKEKKESEDKTDDGEFR